MAKDKVIPSNLVLCNEKFKYDNIEQMVNDTGLQLDNVVELLGYYQAGDGAGHKRVIASEDDGSGVQLGNGLYANIVHNGEVNVSWFGAKNSGTFDSSDFIQKAINCNNVKKLIIPEGHFLCRKTLNLKDYLLIQGINKGSSTLAFEISDTDYAFVFDKGDNAGVFAYNPSFRDLKVFSQGGFLRLADEISPIKDGQGIPYYIQGLISNCTITGNSAYALLCFNKVFDFRVENCEMYAGKGHFSVFRGCDLNSFMNNRLVGGIKTMFVEKRENTFGSQTTYAYNDIMASFGSEAEEERYYFEWDTNAIQILGNYLEGSSKYFNSFFHQKGYWSYTIRDNRCEATSSPKKYLLTISNSGCLGADVSNNTCSVSNFAYINYKGIKGIRLKTAQKWGKFSFTLNEGYNNEGAPYAEEDFPVTLTQNFYSLKFTPNTPYLINSGDSATTGGAVYYKNMLRVEKGGVVRFGGNEKPIKEKGYFNLIIHTNNTSEDGKIYFRTDKMYSENPSLSPIIITKSFLAEDLEIFIVCQTNEGTDLYIKSLELVNCKDTNVLYGNIANFTNKDYIPNGCICIGTNTRHIWNGSEWLILEASTQATSLNTPYYTYKMEQEGVLQDYYLYLDEKYAYDAQVQAEEQTKQEAYENELIYNPELTWEEFLINHPTTITSLEEPVIPETVQAFMNKYLGVKATQQSKINYTSDQNTFQKW